MPPPCKFINAPGGCRRSDCPYDHDQPMFGSSSQICKFYQQGNCRAGTSCRFQHAGTGFSNNQSISGFGQSSFTGGSSVGFGQSQLGSSNQSNPFQSQSQPSNAFGGFHQTSQSNPIGVGFGQTSNLGSSAGFGSGLGGFGSTSTQFGSVFGQQQSSTSSNRFAALQPDSGSSSNPFQQPSSASNPFTSSSSVPNNSFSSTSTNPFNSATTANPFASHFNQSVLSSSSSNNPFASSSNPFASNSSASVSNPFTSNPPTASAFGFSAQTTGTGIPFASANPSSYSANPFQLNSSLSQKPNDAFAGPPPSFPSTIQASSAIPPLSGNSSGSSAFAGTAQTQFQSEPVQQQAGQNSSSVGAFSTSQSPFPNTPAVPVIRRSIYSEEKDLSISDKEEYSSTRFNRIPFLPPARTMI